MVAALSVFLTMSPGGASADSPDVSFVGPAKVNLALSPSTCSRAEDNAPVRGYRGHVFLTVKNAGVAVQAYEITTFPDPALKGHTSFNAPLDKPVKLEAYSVNALGIWFCVSDPRTRNVTMALIVTNPPTTKPATITIDIMRRAPGEAYIKTILGAIAFALLVVTLRLWSWKKVSKVKLWPLGEFLGHAKRPIYTSQTWSFSGSWATTVTAFGAILATVFAASGFLDDVVPGVDVKRFVALDLVFGGVALTAPLVYAAASRCIWSTGAAGRQLTVTGTVGGLAGAVALTLAGVGGQLGTLGLLVSASDAGEWMKRALYLALVFVALLVAWYAFTTMEQLRVGPAPTVSDQTSQAGSRPAIL